MQMPTRKYSATTATTYRFGFNGKEKDKEITSTSTYDYGFRIYNPGLGRFLSVDPLTKSYPWNSTYAFAENDVIRCIDLDGEEKVITVIFSEPSKGKPGLAITTIFKTFHVVTAGLGALTKDDFSSQAAAFEKLAKKGNTTLFLKKLASSTSQAEEASPADIASGNYFETIVEYNYSIIAEENVTINDAMSKLNKDNAQNGIIFNQISNEEIDQVAESFVSKDKIDVTKNDLYYRFPYMAKKLTSAILAGAGSDARAAGSNEEYNGVPYNMIVFASNYASIKSSSDLSLKEDILHESGHNDAKTNAHGTGNYEYTQNGTQSNDQGHVNHTKKNTLTLLNDTTNRKNTTTLIFDNTKLNNEN
jgi:RHS repeat-associated protein